MTINSINTYLVHPGKNSISSPKIGGTNVPLNGKLFDLLKKIYEKSNNECNIEISFNKNDDGKQKNELRDLLIVYLKTPSIENGRKIAEQLEIVTTKRSGLGLLFLIIGTEGINTKIVISRFPADNAILAEEDQNSLTIEFLERVFMKSATAYKAAVYEDSSLSSGFWLGKAVDKQINNRESKLSEYWIADFLGSDFRTTAAAATRRLAVALRNAARKSTDIEVKGEITAAASLAKNIQGSLTSIEEFGHRFGLSDQAKKAISDEIHNPSLLGQKFNFSNEEFQNILAYRSVELDTGVMLTANSHEFDDVFDREIVDDKRKRVRYSTTGRVVNESLRKSS
jgi:hypothetical protein